MLKREKNIPIPSARGSVGDDLVLRSKLMRSILTELEAGESALFVSANIRSWRVAFTNMSKTDQQKLKEFVTRKVKGNQYRIWRVK